MFSSLYNDCRVSPEIINETRTYDESDQEQKVPIRMLERRILSFTQTTVPHDLNRLKQHKENIILYHKDCNWTKLNIEQVNASRTVQVHVIVYHNRQLYRDQVNNNGHASFHQYATSNLTCYSAEGVEIHVHV